MPKSLQKQVKIPKSTCMDFKVEHWHNITIKTQQGFDGQQFICVRT